MAAISAGRGPVDKHRTGRAPGAKGRIPQVVGGLTGCEDDAQRLPKRIDQHVPLGSRIASGTPRRVIGA